MFLYEWGQDYGHVRFQTLCQGHHVCLVGNGRQSENISAREIDAADVVIRFNQFRCDGSRGYKTSLCFYNGSPKVVLPQDHLSINQIPLVKLPILSCCPELTDLLGTRPSLGLFALWVTMQSRARKITLADMDFSPLFSETLSFPLAHPARYHNWLGELRIVRSLFEHVCNLTEIRASNRLLKILGEIEQLENKPGRVEGKLAVLITTHNRSELLKNRSFNSVLNQTKQPDYVLICDDSTADVAYQNFLFVSELKKRFEIGLTPKPELVYLPNKRTPGLSGNTNTGLMWLKACCHPDHCLVATLDDDDGWDTDYLLEIWEAYLDGADFIVSGIYRHETAGVKQLTIPKQIRSKDFIIGNPNVQGSNKAVTLSAWLQIGGMDEYLPACTDRDVGTRLLDLTGIRVKIIAKHLVNHFVNDQSIRLTSKGSLVHQKGVYRFYHKFGCRLSQDEKKLAVQRHLKYHGFDPFGFPADDSLEFVQTLSNIEISTCGLPISFDIGLTVLPHEDPKLLLTDLEDLHKLDNVYRVRLIVAGLPETLAMVKSYIAPTKIEMIPVELSTAEPGHPFGSIASNRQRIRQAIKGLPDSTSSIVWLADADMSLRNGDQSIEKLQRWLRWLLRLKDLNIDCVIGSYCGAPPIPAAAMMRSQLLDLVFNLDIMAALSADDLWPDTKDHNQKLAALNPENYYDLGPHAATFGETPFLFEPERQPITAREALILMASRLNGLLLGEPVTRACKYDHKNVLEIQLDGHACGGATFIFNKQLLDVPLTVPQQRGRYTRRGDMLWAMLAGAAGFKIVQSPLPVYQKRALALAAQMDFGKWEDDLFGHATAVTVRAIIKERCSRQDRPLGPLSLAEKEGFQAGFRTAINNRMTQFEENFYRIMGLVRTLERFFFLGPKINGERVRYWWLYDSKVSSTLDQFADFLRLMQRTYQPGQLHAIQSRVETVQFETFLNWAESSFFNNWRQQC